MVSAGAAALALALFCPKLALATTWAPYEVTDPMQPKLTGSVRIGGIARHDAHLNGKPFAGGPQMTEISRDGQRVYFTNGLYSRWDTQFYPGGVPGAQVMCHVDAHGGLTLDRDFFVEFGPEYGAH